MIMPGSVRPTSVVHSATISGRVSSHQLGKPEVQDLDYPVPGHEDVAGLEVAVDDPLRVGCCESSCDLCRDLDRLAQGQWPLLQPLAERLPLEQFGDQVRHALVRADIMQGENVGVIQRGDRARLLLSGEGARVGGESCRRTLIATSRPSRVSRAR
jgi:hypothetical protein